MRNISIEPRHIRKGGDYSWLGQTNERTKKIYKILCFNICTLGCQISIYVSKSLKDLFKINFLITFNRLFQKRWEIIRSLYLRVVYMH